MKCSDFIAESLLIHGVTHVFEVVGGMITHLVDSLNRQAKIQIVSVHHEQAAAFAADAMGRLTGRPGVAMATSGPGATNLLTGIGSCYFDSVPAVFITGQVNRSEQKGTRPVRQLGFQETDIVAMAAPVTKAAWRVTRAEDIPALMRSAFETAVSGRPGPVLIDVPMDVQREDLSPHLLAAPSAAEDNSPVDPMDIEQVLTAAGEAQRPLVLIGGGVRAARADHLCRRFIDRIGFPVVSSLMGLDVLPYSHPLRVGMIGSYGNRWANLAVGRCDFLLVLGSRLDVRQTGSDTAAFVGGRTIYHVDCDAAEVNNRVTGCHRVLAHLRPFLAQAEKALATTGAPCSPEWLHEIAQLRRSWPDTAELAGVPGINPNDLMHQLSSKSALARAYVTDVGQHQMWAAQSLELCEGQRFLTSGGMGAMGFGLPAAVGAAILRPEIPVVLIAGDGGFQLNIQELQTVARNKLPIKIVILNNKCHGMVRQFQETYFNGRYQSTYWGYSAPHFDRVAQAYGIASCSVAAPDELQAGLDELWNDPASAFLVEVAIEPLANTYPKIAFGQPMTEMEPQARPVAMEST